MSAPELKTYEILKTKLGEQKINQKKDVFLTKDDKIDLIKWMVVFWVAQMAAIIGLYIKSH